MTFTLAITSPFFTVCPASLYTSSTIPEICGLIRISSRGSTFPVATVVFSKSVISGVAISYCLIWGFDLLYKKANVPTKMAATTTTNAIFTYFFIVLILLIIFHCLCKHKRLFCFVFKVLCYSSRMASIGLIDMARYAGASPASTPKVSNSKQVPMANQKLIWKCA